MKIKSKHLLVILLISAIAVLTNLLGLRLSAFAQTIIPTTSEALLQLTPAYLPTVINGLKVYPDNPLEFDFYVSPSEEGVDPDSFEDEVTKIIKYFMAALTVPEEQMWVNLSPYEKDRIIPQEFGLTEMGRDLLAQDYLLKQMSGSLMYPESQLGEEFWSEMRIRAQEEYGVEDIPLSTFNKIWIIPDKAVVYEKDMSAFVVETHLKIMLEEDYVALQHHIRNDSSGMEQLLNDDRKVISQISSEVVKDLILPAIEKEVNEGKTFANLRQIYHSMILASWYKQRLKESILGQVYVDQVKIKGVDFKDQEDKEVIYQKYLKIFQDGIYEIIKEEYDPITQQIIPKKYFSGGGDMAMLTAKVMDIRSSSEELSQNQKISFSSKIADTLKIKINLREFGSQSSDSFDPAMLEEVLDLLNEGSDNIPELQRYANWSSKVERMNLIELKDYLNSLKEFEGYVEQDELDKDSITRLYGVGKTSTYRSKDNKRIFYKLENKRIKGGFSTSDIILEALLLKGVGSINPLMKKVHFRKIGITSDGFLYYEIFDNYKGDEQSDAKSRKEKQKQISVQREDHLSEQVARIKPTIKAKQLTLDFDAKFVEPFWGEIISDEDNIVKLLKEYTKLRQEDGDSFYGVKGNELITRIQWMQAYNKIKNDEKLTKDIRLYVVRNNKNNMINGMVLYSKRRVTFDLDLLDEFGLSVFNSDVWAYFVDAIGVLPSAQERGLGTKMMAHVANQSLLDQSLKYDLGGLIYSEPAEDDVAQSFHRNLGFQPVIDRIGQESESTRGYEGIDMTGQFMYLPPKNAKFLSEERIKDRAMNALESVVGERLSSNVENERVQEVVNKNIWLEDGRLNKDGILLAHAAQGFPKDGILRPNSHFGDEPLLLRMPREIVEFSWNNIVHDWHSADYLVLLPLKNVTERNWVNLRYAATSHMGPFELPKGSVLMIRESAKVEEDQVQNLRNKGIKIVYFENKSWADTSAKKVIKSMGYQPMDLFSKVFGGYEPSWIKADSTGPNDYLSPENKENFNMRMQELSEELGINSSTDAVTYDVGYLTSTMERLYSGIVKEPFFSHSEIDIQKFDLVLRRVASNIKMGSSDAMRRFVFISEFYRDFYSIYQIGDMDRNNALNYVRPEYIERQYDEFSDEIDEAIIKRDKMVEKFNHLFGLNIGPEDMQREEDFHKLVRLAAEKRSQEFEDRAMNASEVVVDDFTSETTGINSSEEPKYGGIDLNSAQMSLEIRRDDKGVPLPVSQQPVVNMQIEGFVPIIVDISPAQNVSILMGIE